MKILKFYADWCAPCKLLSETLSGMDANILVEPVNVEKEKSMCMEYGVRSIPTLVLIDEHSIEIGRLNGNQPESKILELLRKIPAYGE